MKTKSQSNVQILGKAIIESCWERGKWVFGISEGRQTNTHLFTEYLDKKQPKDVITSAVY